MKRLIYKTLVSEIQELPGAGRLVLPLLQIGSVPLEACVGVGDEVQRGQCIGRAEAPESAFLHSPLAGKVSALSRAVTHEGDFGRDRGDRRRRGRRG